MSSLFQEMEEFTLFDGLVPSSALSEYGPAVEDQLDVGILFPGDSLVKNAVCPGELFDDFLSNGSIEDPFSQEWMETVDLSSLLDEAVISQPIAVDKKVLPKPTGNSRLLEELLTQPIKIKSSPTVSNVQIVTNSEIDTGNVHIQIADSSEIDTPSILQQAMDQIEGLDALVLDRELRDLYNASISSNDTIGIENTSSNVSLMDNTSSEFLIASPLSTEDIDSILSYSEPSSPSSSIQDDPDYIPSGSDEKKSKRSSKSHKVSKMQNRPSPYEKNIEKSDRKERKRIQNRNAAIRYREKKRAERGVIVSEEDELAARNKELRTKVEQLSNEIKYMKTLLTEVCEARGLKIQFK